jgi:hypothetical protein
MKIKTLATIAFIGLAACFAMQFGNHSGQSAIACGGDTNNVFADSLACGGDTNNVFAGELAVVGWTSHLR